LNLSQTERALTQWNTVRVRAFLFNKENHMYAMTGKLIARNGKRDDLIAILKQAAVLVGKLPECHLYVVCEDLANDTHVWVFETWRDKQAHDDSLGDETVRALISNARPLLAAAPDGAELRVMGGHGI
jgi:quinol monooxygenase YgiN